MKSGTQWCRRIGQGLLTAAIAALLLAFVPAVNADAAVKEASTHNFAGKETWHASGSQATDYFQSYTNKNPDTRYYKITLSTAGSVIVSFSGTKIEKDSAKCWDIYLTDSEGNTIYMVYSVTGLDPNVTSEKIGLKKGTYRVYVDPVTYNENQAINWVTEPAKQNGYKLDVDFSVDTGFERESNNIRDDANKLQFTNDVISMTGNFLPNDSMDEDQYSFELTETAKVDLSFTPGTVETPNAFSGSVWKVRLTDSYGSGVTGTEWERAVKQFSKGASADSNVYFLEAGTYYVDIQETSSAKDASVTANYGFTLTRVTDWDPIELEGDPSGDLVINKGHSEPIEITSLPQDMYDYVDWSVDGGDYISLNKTKTYKTNNSVIGEKVGSGATVTATAYRYDSTKPIGVKSWNVKVTSSQIPATGIDELEDVYIFITSSDTEPTKKITATVTPADTTDSADWDVPSDGVIKREGWTPIENGETTCTVKAIAAGTTTVTLTVGGIPASCTVTVIDQRSMTGTITGTTTAPVGGTSVLSVTTDPKTSALTWDSSDDSIAKVSSTSGTSATVTAVKEGTARISVYYGNSLIDYCIFTVTAKLNPVTNLAFKVKKGSLNLKEGETVTLEPKYYPADATDAFLELDNYDYDPTLLTPTVNTDGTVTFTAGKVDATTWTTVIGSTAGGVMASVNIVLQPNGTSPEPDPEVPVLRLTDVVTLEVGNTAKNVIASISGGTEDNYEIVWDYSEGSRYAKFEETAFTNTSILTITPKSKKTFKVYANIKGLLGSEQVCEVVITGGDTPSPDPDPDPDPEVKPEAGDVFEWKNAKSGATIQYKALTVSDDEKTGTAAVVGISSGSAKPTDHLKLADKIQYHDVIFTITEIESGAFEDYSGITKITVGKYVTKIGARAFAGCTKAKKIIIKAQNLQSVGNNAFSSTPDKAKVKVLASKVSSYKSMLQNAGLSKNASIKGK